MLQLSMPSSRRKPVIIGITGGIACGKSTVVKICQSRGAAIVDADLLGHKSYSQGTECYHQLIRTFGEEIVGEDGNINRRALGSIVFSSPAEKKKLEGIVWPEIRRLMKQEIAAILESGTEQTIVVEAAVMLEAGWETEVDEVWVVAVEPEVAKQRLMTRNKLTETEAQKRIASQMTNSQRIKKADRVIWNDGTRDELEEEVDVAWKERGTLRTRKQAVRNRLKILGAILGFAVIAALNMRRGRLFLQ